MGLPTVAVCQLHPAPPQSYTVFLAGCNFRCLNCQNWFIAHQPGRWEPVRGFVDPMELAREGLEAIRSPMGRWMGADRLFFSGGEPTIHLPYVEVVMRAARKLDPSAKANFDTNGFLTRTSLERVLSFTTSITFDLKAFHDDVHRAVTGAPVEPVLRNAEYVARHAKDKLWEFRTLVIPGVVAEEEVRAIALFLASIDPSLPLCLLVFRPNFVMDQHPGATDRLMLRCLKIAREAGLENVTWSGSPNIPGVPPSVHPEVEARYPRRESRIAATYAYRVGCRTHPRFCGTCTLRSRCPVRQYVPYRTT